MALVNSGGTMGSYIEEPPTPPAIHPKAKHENIRVSPSVLEAAKKAAKSCSKPCGLPLQAWRKRKLKNAPAESGQMLWRKSAGKAGSFGC